MSDEFKTLMSSLPESMRWTPPAPDPDAALKQEYHLLVSNDRLRFFRDGDRNVNTPSWEQFSKGRTAAEKAAQAKEQAGLEASAKASREQEARNAKEIARLEKEIERGESVAKVKRIDDYMIEKGWNPRGGKRGKAIRQMTKMGLLAPPKGAA